MIVLCPVSRKQFHFLPYDYLHNNSSDFINFNRQPFGVMKGFVQFQLTAVFAGLFEGVICLFSMYVM